jgi:hypothetical protein
LIVGRIQLFRIFNPDPVQPDDSEYIVAFFLLLLSEFFEVFLRLADVLIASFQIVVAGPLDSLKDDVH